MEFLLSARMSSTWASQNGHFLITVLSVCETTKASKAPITDGRSFKYSAVMNPKIAIRRKFTARKAGIPTETCQCHPRLFPSPMD
jgi:hypothetical protein